MRLVIRTSLLLISVVLLNSIQLSYSQSEKKGDSHNRNRGHQFRPLTPNVQNIRPPTVPDDIRNFRGNIPPEAAEFLGNRAHPVPNDIRNFRGNIPPEAAGFLESRALPVPYGEYHRNLNNPLNERVLQEHNNQANECVGTSEHPQLVRPTENVRPPNNNESQFRHYNPN